MNNNAAILNPAYTIESALYSCDYGSGKTLDNIICLLPQSWNHEAFVWNFTEIAYCKTLEEVKSLLNERKLVELRVFNKEEELFVWRSGDKLFSYRHRVDKEEAETNNGDRVDYIDTGMKLRGGIVKDIVKKKDGEIWFIKTRNYIAGCQAQYVDSRFVELLIKK